ncbi:response regulator transcription factor [Planosporangium thailandense]|uniref:response regulator transcription factor n=1 Tax=Planosporangium thailandense TaxID=765197 RepID=UPI001F10815C|nr:response regulator transcription factor [Planosporangium thailandense]
MIRILLGREGRVWREALASVLASSDGLEVVAELAHTDEVPVVAARERPDAVVLDHALPGSLTVPDLCEKLGVAAPRSVVLVLLDRRGGALSTALARLAPRVGVLTTDATPWQLVDSVRQLIRGEPVLDAKVAVAALTARHNPLTDREREVLRLAADGAPAKEIAAQLYLSAGTVRNYLSRVIAKTGARTRIEAIRIAQGSGWI